MTLPSRHQSRAILIGTSEYKHDSMHDLPAVANNLIALQEAFCDRKVWGLPPQHCRLIEEPATLPAMLVPLREAAGEAEDTLLVYYAGHGLIDTEGELHLSLTDTNSDPSYLPYTAVPYSQIRRAVLSSPAARRVVILDTCFSGRALGAMSSTDSVLQGVVDITGTVILTASPKTQAASAPTGAHFTAFTAELLEVLLNGISGQPQHLSIKAIYRHIHAKLKAAGRPLPQILNSNTAEELSLAINRAFRSHPKPDNPAAKKSSPETPPGYGAIAGIELGALFPDRRALHDAKVHRPLEAGICGTRAKGGAESIVLSGGYKDDKDYGDVIIYTGHGGQASNGAHIADQDPNSTGNSALIASRITQIPVRVIRGAQARTPFSPPTGYSYDGLFRVADYWTEPGKDGFLIIRFRLEGIEQLESVTNTPSIAPDRWSPVARGVFQDRQLSERLKKLYDYECQVCGIAIETMGGMRHAETFHFRSLGAPHKGPDILANMVCLCPNHHMLFELGTLTLDDTLRVIDQSTGAPITDLHIHRRHQIDLEHVKYHRNTHDPRLLRRHDFAG